MTFAGFKTTGPHCDCQDRSVSGGCCVRRDWPNVLYLTIRLVEPMGCESCDGTTIELHGNGGHSSFPTTAPYYSAGNNPIPFFGVEVFPKLWCNAVGWHLFQGDHLYALPYYTRTFQSCASGGVDALLVNSCDWVLAAVTQDEGFATPGFTRPIYMQYSFAPFTPFGPVRPDTADCYLRLVSCSPFHMVGRAIDYAGPPIIPPIFSTPNICAQGSGLQGFEFEITE